MAFAPVGGAWREVGVVRHVFTHFSLDLTVLETATSDDDVDLIWTPIEEAIASTPSLFAKGLRLLR